MRPHRLDVLSLVFGLLFVGTAVGVPLLAGALPLRPLVVAGIAALAGGALLAGALRHRDR